MADDADWSAERQSVEIAMALKNFRRYVDDRQTSHEFCVECGDRIPAARREAVPGCTMCVSCQEIEDNGGCFWA